LVAVLLFAVVAGDFLVTGPTGVFSGVSQEAPADIVASTAPVEEPRALEYEVEVTTVVAEAEPVEKVAVAASPSPEEALPAESLRVEEEAAPTEAAEGGVGVQSSELPMGETKEAEAVVESVPPAPSAPEPEATEAAEDSVEATPTPLPTEPAPTFAPTVVAEVDEASASEPWLGEHDVSQPGVRRDRQVFWFGVAELALGVLFVLLATVTVFVMIRQRRAR
jgi:hypothetical protein